MPKVEQEIPENLKPYLFHGLQLNWKSGDKQAAADECPFCGGSRFTIEIATSKSRCWSCWKEGGNSSQFIREMSKQGCSKQTDYSSLAESRGVRFPETLERWEIFKSPVNGDWMVPGYGDDGVLRQLYRYSMVNGKYQLRATTGLRNQLFGMALYVSTKPMIFLCEGPWDAIVLWEVLSKTRETEDGYVRTSNESKSLLSKASVLAVPGVTTFFNKWRHLFGDKVVNIMYDSDHPKPNPKKDANDMIPPAGHTYMKRVTEIISSASVPPKEMNYLNWGELGYDPDLPSGTDVRDVFAAVDDPIDGLSQLLDKLSPVPAEWLSISSSEEDSGPTLDCSECKDYKTMTTAWRKALKWTEGLDRALSVMLASIASTKIIGDQLWIKVIGPASCGKSTLCEAISVNKEFVIAKSTIRGFHSGFKTGNDDKEDNSLISKIAGKTLVTKDGDTLLQSPNLGQILAEARDLYDCTSRTHYRNKMSKNYSGIRMTWILCGTSSLRSIDSSELGERFLDCVIMDRIDDELEDEILWRVVNRAERNTNIEADGQADTHNEPSLTEAMKLTGGYVGYLRSNALDLMSTVTCSTEALKKCTRLAKFVACMRARPSWRQMENSEREVAFRLGSQLVRLAKCLAVVLNQTDVDGDVMRRVKQTAMDTSRGFVREIVEDIYNSEDGCAAKGIGMRLNHTEQETGRMLRFLRQIEVVNLLKVEATNKNKWFLTSSMTKLYEDIVGIGDA